MTVATNFYRDFLASYDDFTVVSTKGLPREEWLKWRERGIGGSEIAAILGKSLYDSALSVYLSKLNLIPPKEDNEAMYFGRSLESFVAAEFESRSAFSSFDMHRMIRHPVYEFMIANVDRVIYDVVMGFGLLECKTASAYKLPEWEGGTTPEYYYYQVQHYLAVTGLSFAYIACLVGGQKFFYNYIARDEAVIQEIMEGATEFWFNHVTPQVPPEVTHLDTKNLQRLYPMHKDDEWLNITEDEAWLWDELLKTKEQLRIATQADNLAVNRVKQRMQTAELLYLGGEQIVTWRRNKAGQRRFVPNIPKEGVRE